MPFPAGKVDRQRHAGETRRPRRTAQHLLLLGSEILADADLADDAGGDDRHVVGDAAAVARDCRRDLIDRHGADIVGVRRLEIETGAHDDVEAGATADLLQGGGVAADAEIGRIDHGAAAKIGEALSNSSIATSTSTS